MNLGIDYRNFAFEKIMKSVSNRRLIQHLRLKLFVKLDFQPKNFKKLNLTNSNIEKDYFFNIKNTAKDILECLEENNQIYEYHFAPDMQGLTTNVRDMLLPGEENLFQLDCFYCYYLRNLFTDTTLELLDPTRYYQEIYDFIMLDLTYDHNYDFIRIIDSDSE